MSRKWKRFMDLFHPRRPAYQTINGRNLIPRDSKLPRVLALVALIFVLLSSLFDARAATVDFTGRELQAGYVLVRPESTTLTLDGRKGELRPAPALRYFGLEPRSFDLDLTVIGDWVDLRFDALTAKMPTVRFLESALEIEVPFEDRARAIRSSVGNISLKGVSLAAVLNWVEVPGGARELRLRATRFKGIVKGSGLLALAEGKVRSLAMKALSEQVNDILRKPQSQDAILEGLTQWARISTGDRTANVDPATLRFFNDGIRFETR